MAMAYGLLLILLAVVAPMVNGVDYTVGGTDGWSQSADYATWASGKTFTVGDNLLFGYSSMHKLDIVSKGDYDKCNSGNSIKSYTDGQTTVPLTKPGPMYFICPTSGHCANGMKLAITVVAASTTTAPSGSTPPSILSPPTSSSSSSGGDGYSTPAPKTDNSGGEGQNSHFNRAVIGLTLVVVGLVSFMG